MSALISICYFPLSFIEAFVIISLSTTLFNISYTKKQKLIFIIFSSVLNTLYRLVIPTAYQTLFNIITMILLIKYIFNIKVLKAIVCLIIPFVSIIILESFISAVSSYIMNVSIYELDNFTIYTIVCPLLIYSVIYTVYLILKKFDIKITILDNFTLTGKSKLVITGILGLTALYLNLYVIFFYSSHLPYEITMINILVLIIYLVVTTYCLMKANKFETAKQNIECLQLYNKTLTTMHDDIRAFKHDFNNILQAIGGYIETEDLTSLKNYYKDLVKDSYSVTNLETLKPEIINNPCIYSILASKYYKGDAKNIQINFDLSIDFNSLNISTYEFSRILGILLDNAIEAAEECDEKIINIKFYNDNKNNRHLVIIENTYINKDVDTIKIFEKSYTTKECNTGLGLWEVNKILNKRCNLSLFTTKNDKFFIQQLEIYKK